MADADPSDYCRMWENRHVVADYRCSGEAALGLCRDGYVMVESYVAAELRGWMNNYIVWVNEL